MDIRWHHYKHCQIPNLTFSCWRACWYDRTGYLDHPIRSPDAKVMQITSFELVFCRGCRPAGLGEAGRPGTFAEHILPCHKTIRDPPMDPYALDIQVNTKVTTERPSTWIKGPIFSTCWDLLGWSTTMDFIHMLISKPMKWRAEKWQLQAGRPTIQRWSQATYTDI